MAKPRTRKTRAARGAKQQGLPIDPARRSRLLDHAKPSIRPLKAYAFDPSHGTLMGNAMTLSVRYEELRPGPVVKEKFAWDGIAVIDYDATNDCWYEPIDLDDPRVLIRNGLDPVEGDPRFHQQMVYAVITETIQHFEAALGRRIHWYRARQGSTQDSIYTLNIFPHAMLSPNAFYSRKAHGILFGYFRASEDNPGRNLPGQIVYTCLSHDIIVHETTHAIIDGIRQHFTEPTNPDVIAFHEAFADLVALFRHFSHGDVLLDAIVRTGGKLFEEMLAPDAPPPDSADRAAGDTAQISAQIRQRNPLVELAQQFGEATGRGRGLRSALTHRPNTRDIETTFEPHARGAILVAAVFDAYFTIYMKRTADLFRIYRAGGASVDQDIPIPLARMLCDHASKTADQFFHLCVRALDYCPPMDITFGDFLRAMITADFDLHPTDELGVRDALMQAFRVRGIVPDGAAFFSEAAIAWPKADGVPSIPNLEFGDPTGLTDTQKNAAGKALRDYFADPAVRAVYARLGVLDESGEIELSSFHPVFRIGEEGDLRTEMIVEVAQLQTKEFDPGQKGLGTFPIRGGATLIIGKPSLVEARREFYENQNYVAHGKVRYVIGKPLGGEAGVRRENAHRSHFSEIGLVEGMGDERFAIDFALTHGGY